MATPGWNDPPNVAYSSANVTTSKKTTLNKRVPFPQNGSLLPTSGNESICQKGGVILVPPVDDISIASTPPAPLVIPPPPPSQEKDSSEDSTLGLKGTQPSTNDDDDEPPSRELHDETITILKCCFSLCSQTLQKRTIEDIEKRLTVLSTTWVSGKLNRDVQMRMHKLTQALKKGDYEEANGIHLALIVDHVGQVSPWMVAIKHLIHEARNQNVSIATEDTKENIN